MVEFSATTYAGDLTAQEAWDLLAKDPKAQLVDVRTAAEWAFVGLPDLSAVGRQAVCNEWQMFPTMVPNPDFVGAFDEARDRQVDIIDPCSHQDKECEGHQCI